MPGGMGVYLGAGRSEYLKPEKPGVGARALLLAKSMGIDVSEPSQVIPLMIAQARAQAEHDVRLMSGFACVIASAFGKPSMQDWLESLAPPAEVARIKRQRENRDAELRNRAMLAKVRMMAERFDITEVHE